MCFFTSSVVLLQISEWTLAKDSRFSDFEAPAGRKQRPKLPNAPVEVTSLNTSAVMPSAPADKDAMATSNPYATLDESPRNEQPHPKPSSKSKSPQTVCYTSFFNDLMLCPLIGVFPLCACLPPEARGSSQHLQPICSSRIGHLKHHRIARYVRVLRMFPNVIIVVQICFLIN